MATRRRSVQLTGKMHSIIGSRAQVWHGTAHHTKGGLTKAKLTQNKRGRIVSKKRQAIGERQVKKLMKLGFCPGKIENFKENRLPTRAAFANAETREEVRAVCKGEYKDRGYEIPDSPVAAKTRGRPKGSRKNVVSAAPASVRMTRAQTAKASAAPVGRITRAQAKKMGL